MYEILKIVILLSWIGGLQGVMEVQGCSKSEQIPQKCSQCMSGYHLFEEKCYEDILGCGEYRSGNICMSCESEYLLNNNYCCDQHCLLLIFSDEKDTGLDNNHNNFNVVLEFIQKVKLNSTIFILNHVKIENYQLFRRYFVEYTLATQHLDIEIRRAIVDWYDAAQQIFLIDWNIVPQKPSLVRLDDNQGRAVLEKGNIYQYISTNVTSFSIFVRNFTEIPQYQMFFLNGAENTIEWVVFYVVAGKGYIIKHQTRDNSIFNPYKNGLNIKKNVYQECQYNQTIGKIVNFTINSVSGLFYTDLKRIVEWSDTPNLVFFHLFFLSFTHKSEIVVEYLLKEQQQGLHLISEDYKQTLPEEPVLIQLPPVNSNEIQVNGQYWNLIADTSSQQAQQIIYRITQYAKAELSTIPPSYYSIITSANITAVHTIKNCKFIEVTLIYLIDKVYYFAYFLEEITLGMFRYLGIEKSQQNLDPSFKQSQSTLSTQQFQKILGYKPTFVNKTITGSKIRQGGFFQRKCITVQGLDRVANYYFYTKMVNSSVELNDLTTSETFVNCICQFTSLQSPEGHYINLLNIKTVSFSSANIWSRSDRNYKIVQVYIGENVPEVEEWGVQQIEMTEYDRYTAYLVIMGKEGRVIVINLVVDKKNNIFLVNYEETDSQASQQFMKKDFMLYSHSAMQSESTTRDMIEEAMKNLTSSITFKDNVLLVLRKNVSSHTQKNIIIFKENNEKYWIMITMFNSNKNQPYILAFKSISSKVLDSFTQLLNKVGFVNTLQTYDEKHAIREGILRNIDIVQVEVDKQFRNISPQIKSILIKIISEQNIAEIQGTLVEVQQHSDVINNLYAISFQVEPALYRRYYGVKCLITSQIYYLGSQVIHQSPMMNLFFSNEFKDNSSSIPSIVRFINAEHKKAYKEASVQNHWEIEFPLASYDITYVLSESQSAISYNLVYQDKIVSVYFASQSNKTIQQLLLSRKIVKEKILHDQTNGVLLLEKNENNAYVKVNSNQMSSHKYFQLLDIIAYVKDNEQYKLCEVASYKMIEFSSGIVVKLNMTCNLPDRDIFHEILVNRAGESNEIVLCRTIVQEKIISMSDSNPKRRLFEQHQVRNQMKGQNYLDKYLKRQILSLSQISFQKNPGKNEPNKYIGSKQPIDRINEDKYLELIVENIRKIRRYYESNFIGSFKQVDFQTLKYTIYFRTKSRVIIKLQVIFDVKNFKDVMVYEVVQNFTDNLHQANAEVPLVKHLSQKIFFQQSQSIEGVEYKLFFQGFLLKIVTSLKNHTYTSLVYIRSQQFSVLAWRYQSLDQNCKLKEKEECLSCQDGFQLISGHCIRNCGKLCQINQS